MFLHNTLSGKKEEFVPLHPGRVSLYLCGPTVYSYAHIGNARPSTVFDVLTRVLRRRYAQVTYVRNITDIDDKINKAAAEQGVDISVITQKFTQAYHEDLAALGIAKPDAEPRVTEHLPQIIAMIQKLIASGHAYEAQSHVMFHVPSYAGYGQLSRRDRKEMIAGARVEVAPYKKDPGDFVLWKPSGPGPTEVKNPGSSAAGAAPAPAPTVPGAVSREHAATPGWDSPWGRGRPGWHIECSAMSEALLGETIDIHGGGHDLIFPHHENERAQSTCAHGGKIFARYWLHNGFLTMNSEKMSKSVGNVLLVREILKHAPGEAVRLALLTGHYRQPLDWNDEALADAKRKLDRLYGALRELGDIAPAANVQAPASFVAALEDDLNTPQALAELFELARAANKAETLSDKATLKAQLLDAGLLMGLLQQSPAAWFAQAPAAAGQLSAAEIETALAARIEARKNKQWTESDRIRDELKAKGVLVEDGKDGQRWRYL